MSSILSLKQNKNRHKVGLNFMAERVGFEPTDRITTVTD